MEVGYGSQIRGRKYISRSGISYWGDGPKEWDDDLPAYA